MPRIVISLAILSGIELSVSVSELYPSSDWTLSAVHSDQRDLGTIYWIDSLDTEW